MGRSIKLNYGWWFTDDKIGRNCITAEIDILNQISRALANDCCEAEDSDRVSLLEDISTWVEALGDMDNTESVRVEKV